MLVRDHESQGRQSKHTGEETSEPGEGGGAQELPGQAGSRRPKQVFPHSQVTLKAGLQKQRLMEVFWASFHVLTEDRGLF